MFLWLTRSCVCVLLGWLNKLVIIQFWRHQVQYGYFFTLYYFMKILGLFLFVFSHVLRHYMCTIALTVTFTNPNTCALFDHMPARWHTWAFPSSPLASWDHYFLATIPDASGHPTTNWSVSDVFFHFFFCFYIRWFSLNNLETTIYMVFTFKTYGMLWFRMLIVTTVSIVQPSLKSYL